MRHGKKDRPEEINEVADSLEEALESLPGDLRVLPHRVEHSDAEEAEHTASIIAQRLEIFARKAPEERDLGPKGIGPYSDPRTVETRVEQAKESIDSEFRQLSRTDANALVIVGHSPALDWFLAACSKGDLTIARAEVLCLVRKRDSTRAWRLWWAITPSAPGVISEMRDKIASKMTVLSVLAGFATAILATVLLDVPQGSPERALTFASAASFALAAALLVGTLFAYDRLMMPTRFWRTGRLTRASDPLHAWPVWRPPSSAAWVLFQQSVTLWRWAGVALGLGALATWLLAAAAARPTTAAGWISIAVAGLVPLALALTWWHTQKPRLGFED